MSYRVLPSVFVGAELWYLRHYDGAWFNTFTGDAFFLGPTAYFQLGRKVFMTAAWNVQIQAAMSMTRALRSTSRSSRGSAEN